jgi:ATP-dependent DNA helicase DinG
LNYVAIDVETTGLNATTDEIIEVGGVRVVGGEIADTFHRLFKPSRPLSDEIVALTGITNSMLQDAASIEDVLPELLNFIGDEPIVAHNAEFDISFLQQTCERQGLSLRRADGLCTLMLSRVLLPTLTSHRLAGIAAHCGIETGASHRALDDATTCARLLEKLEQAARQLPLLVLQHLTQMAGLLSEVTADWFIRQSESVMREKGDDIPDTCEVRDGLVYSLSGMPNAAGPSQARENNSSGHGEPIGAQARAILATGGKLSEMLAGYEAREGQLQMVEQVANAFDDGKHALIEAGTGTGKSMAYLIPAALYAKQTGQRVAVSTHTIALQDQIEQRDFPTLQKIFDDKLTLAVQKGRNHYVCMRKVKAEAAQLSFISPKEDIENLMSLLVWLVNTKEGVREELTGSVVKRAIWARVQSETDTCINKRCPFFRPCYYFRAKTRGQMADIVVTNHSLMLADIKADHRVLPKYEALIIDEAHHLEEQATKHLGGEVHAAQLAFLSYRLTRDKGKTGILPELLTYFQNTQSMPLAMEERLHKAQEWIDEIHRQAEVAFQYLGALVPYGRNEQRLTDELREHPDFLRFSECMSSLRAPLAALAELGRSLQEWSKQAATDEEAGRIVDAAGYLDQWLQGVRLLEEMTVANPEMVAWVERRGAQRPRYSLHTAPIDVSDTLQRTLFEPMERIILTSATLSIKGRFDYTVAQLGLRNSAENEKLLTANVPSPFNFARQARLCVPSDVPELAKMSSADAAAWLGDSLYQLAIASEGRMLTLFTSHQMLRDTATLLRDPLRQQNIAVFAQDIDGSRTAMLDAFRKNPRSVLLGAQSFWEGIDLPGDQLTTLVIVRLPFAPPSHPVTEARHERLTANGKSPFWIASLPEAVVRFRQGFGRLIRTRQDKGVVVVYDKRIITQRYGQTFIQSLSGVRPFVAPEQEVLKHVKGFLS